MGFSIESSAFLGTLDGRGEVRGRNLSNCVILRGAGDHALATFDAKVLIDPFFPTFSGKDGLNGTTSNACIATTGTFLQINVKGDKGAAHSCRTAFFGDMGLIFLSEISERREYRVWRGLSEIAK